MSQARCIVEGARCGGAAYVAPGLSARQLSPYLQPATGRTPRCSDLEHKACPDYDDPYRRTGVSSDFDSTPRTAPQRQKRSAPPRLQLLSKRDFE
ncbi:hypothetical protein N7541_009768 [Penicillium brevicompactum]|uniref:Uncharacterized protein n=1 Tax=Penicillium brevicompactum TaxID=5074 RepID=A0A9W9QPP7_PENBR|nr:hypothetical protein N7541_009768 [Penicillium brevicompactum]